VLARLKQKIPAVKFDFHINEIPKYFLNTKFNLSTPAFLLNSVY
jgi:hypothetical protein